MRSWASADGADRRELLDAARRTISVRGTQCTQPCSPQKRRQSNRRIALPDDHAIREPRAVPEAASSTNNSRFGHTDALVRDAPSGSPSSRAVQGTPALPPRPSNPPLAGAHHNSRSSPWSGRRPSAMEPGAALRIDKTPRCSQFGVITGSEGPPGTRLPRGGKFRNSASCRAAYAMTRKRFRGVRWVCAEDPFRDDQCHPGHRADVRIPSFPART